MEGTVGRAFTVVCMRKARQGQQAEDWLVWIISAGSGLRAYPSCLDAGSAVTRAEGEGPRL